MRKAKTQNRCGVLPSTFRILSFFLVLLLIHQSAFAQKKFESITNGAWTDASIWQVDGNSNIGLELPSKSDTVYVFHQVQMANGTNDSIAQLYILTPISNTQTVRLEIEEGAQLAVEYNAYHYANDPTSTDSVHLVVDGDMVVGDSLIIFEDVTNTGAGAFLTISGSLSIYNILLYDAFNKVPDDSQEEITVWDKGNLDFLNMYLVGAASGASVNFVVKDSASLTQHGSFILFEGENNKEFMLQFFDNATMHLAGSMVMSSVIESPFGYISFHDQTTIEFNGTSPQSIFGLHTSVPGDSVIFNNVILNNFSFPSLLVSYGEVWIRGELDFQNNSIYVEEFPSEGTPGIIVFDTAASSINYGPGAFIDGLAGAYRPSDIVMPVGDTDRFGLIRLYNSSGLASNSLFEVGYSADYSVLDAIGLPLASAPLDLGSQPEGALEPVQLTISLPNGIERISEQEFWTIQDRADAAKVDVELFAEDLEYSGIDDYPTVSVIHTSGGATTFEDAGNGGFSATSVSSSIEIVPDPTTLVYITYGTSDKNTNPFEPPSLQVSGFSPQNAFPGEPVTVYGEAFDLGASITIGGVHAYGDNTDGDTLAFTMPDGAPYAPIAVTKNGEQRSTANPILPLRFLANDILEESSFGDAAQAQQIGNTSSFDSNSDIRAADMNKDGLVDIVYILPGLDLLAVSYQQADGAFIDSTYSFGSAFSPNKIELADFNNDEWMDIVIGTGNTFQVAIYYNDQAGDFVDNYFNSGFPESIFLPTNVETLGVHQLLDVPYPTIAVLGTDHNTYLLSLDETIGTYSVQDTIFGGEGAAGLAFADFNGDGISEMVIGDDGVEGGNYSVYFRNETTGKFQLEGSTGNVPSGYGKDIFIVDIENDGKMEVGAVGLPDDASFTLFFYNDGTSKLEELETHSVPSGKAIRDIHVDNIGGKNGADIVAFTQDGNGLDQEIVIFPSDGSGTFETPITIPAGGMVTTAADIFDVSGNGLPDLIVRGDSTYGNRIWFNALPIGAPNTQPNSLFLDNSIIGQISIDFIAADDAESYLVLRRDPGTAPTGPTDGVQYPLDSVWSDQTVISSGSATSVIDDDVQDNTEYAYDIFAYNNSGTNTAYNSINPLSGNVFTSYDTLAVDSAVLRAIYAALDGPNWSTRTGWGNDPVKDWYGVEVNDGRVTRLDLSDNNLSGTLPDSIAYFAGLEYLDLSGNDLGGSLSEGIGNNELLDTLILRNSQLDGPLPDTIAALPNLTYLDAGGNEFHELPIDWSKSPLEDVRLDSNQLDFGNLEHLLILPLSNFAYSGQDHSEFAGDSLACLDSAILVGNLLEPSADDTYTWLFNGENMTDQTGQDLYIDPLGIEDAGTYQLVVSNSTLTDDTIEYGPFGLYVSTYKSDSVYLDALYDSLGGTGWANAANWTNTDMHDWEGVVATDTGVVAVNLAGQGLVGNLATVEFLSEMARLERLSLADNSLDGPIPYAWEHFASLRALDLSSNNIDYIEAHLDSVSTLDTVYIDDNHLDFDDLFSVEIVGKFDSLSYAPQKALGNTSTNTTETAFYSYSLGTDMVDASTNPTYTWYQDGNQIASADSLYNFELEELSLDNSGSYTVEITATYAPDLTLTDGPFHLLVSSLYEDSVKLTQLYNDWGAGADWTNSTNWNTGTRYDLDTWHGVTTNDTSVVELDLSANGIEDFFVGPEIGYLEGLEKLNLSYNAFQGHFPDEILRLNYLTELNLGNNFFISVPRLDSIESLENVDLGYNLIQFPDLEPLMNQFTNFVVPAMQFWEEQATYTLEAGESIDLSGYPDDGSANTSYQWMFNGSPLPGGTSAVLSLTNVGAEQSGYYILEATNSVVNLLNMSMDTLFIEVSSLAADSQRLADLYSALDGDNWADNTGWNNDTDLNNWFGVKVENNQVVEINLKGNGLTGNLPFNLGEFPGLEILDLSDNQISGDIPGEITNLDNLTDLDLSNNEFVSVTRLDTMASLVNASLKDNFLTFPDLEPLLTAGLTLDVSSMKSWGDANTFNLNVGDDLFLTGYANDGSANTSYQWYLEGAALADQTSADLNISQIETTNSGYYYMEATNSVVTGLTMTIDSILVNVNGLEEDSLRLLQIYDALDGDNWTNNTNWKVDGTTVDTWYGVKVENGLITRLELSNNNLTGEYPQAVRELSGIVFLDLSDNNIFGGVDNPFNWGQIQHVNLGNNDLNYSDSLTLDGLTYLNLSGNQMEFASLQRNLHLDTLIYAPQQPLPDEGDSLLDVGASLSFTINPQSIGGTTQWLWLKDGDTLSSVTDSTLSIDSVLKQNEGDYQVFVRNSLLPELVLETGILGLDVSTLKNDSLALVAIYDTLDGANWNDNSGWKNDLDLNTWAGVTVENYSVTSVDLNNNGLSGSLPVSVPLMSELRFLDLSSNEIEGSMPQGWRRFQKLQTLYLDNNRISEIPDLTQNDSLTELDVTYNQLNFDEIEPLVGFAGGSYTPQGPLTEAVDTLVDVGDAFNFTFAVPGADAIQWYKDGVALPNQTSPTLTIGSAQFEFDGVYIGEATSTAVPGLTLATDSIFLAVSSLERDSALIRTLYLATNGDNWTTQPNWNSEDIRDGNWDFITIENNRVTEINIPNNNLVGFVPRRITDMRFLKTLSLPTNQIFLIPDLTGMENLENVNMSQNRLQFGSIEPNVGLTNFTYSLQGQVGMAKDTVVQQGSPVTFSIVTTGENNTYQWFLNGTAISGATSDSLTIDSVSYDDMGFYTLEINNTQVDDLTLRSANQRVLAYASAGGQVNSAQGPIEDGRMYLFRVQRGRYDTLGPELLATDGLFQFDSVILGDFVMIAAPNKQTYPDGLRTWYGDVLFWQQADTINLRQDEDSLNIDLLGIPEPLDGDFSIAGTVFEDIADSTGRIERQRRVSGATVTVSREINIGRVLETEFEVVAITETDLDGNFEFNFLPANTYRIDIQFPGVPMDSTTSLDITVGATETDSVVNVTALVEEEGIAVSIDEVDGLWNPKAFPIVMYPNPSSGHINLSLGGRRTTAVRIHVLDLNGKELYQAESRVGSSRSTQFNLDHIPPGMYFLMVEDLDHERVQTLQLRLK